MRSGLTIKLRRIDLLATATRERFRPAGLAFLCGLVLLSGCEPPAPTASSITPPPSGGTNIAVNSKPAAAVTAEMVLLPGSRFIMGEKDEVDAPPHAVVVGPFHIDTHLVTQEQYAALMGTNPSRWKGEQNPVEQVRWSDAVRYCNKRSERDGFQPCYDLTTWQCNFDANGYRLPTEAEWEYACRAGSTTPFFFGDSPAKLGRYAWFEKNSGGRPQPVGKKEPNPWGLYDICGNVWEWCNDFYQVDYYEQSPADNPRGPTSGDTKVLRGGAWRFSDQSCRSGYRYNENPGYSDVCFGYDIYGFRCVRKGM